MLGRRRVSRLPTRVRERAGWLLLHLSFGFQAPRRRRIVPRHRRVRGGGCESVLPRLQQHRGLLRVHLSNGILSKGGQSHVRENLRNSGLLPRVSRIGERADMRLSARLSHPRGRGELRGHGRVRSEPVLSLLRELRG